MKSATLQERKRFAAELAERDTAADAARRARLEAACDEDIEQVELVEKLIDEPMPPMRTEEELDAELLRYRMRSWWLDRYTLDEIRELAGCLQ